MNRTLVLTIDGLDYKKLDLLGKIKTKINFTRLHNDLNGKNRHTIPICNALYSGKWNEEITYTTNDMESWYRVKNKMIWELNPSLFRVINMPCYFNPNPYALNMGRKPRLGTEKDYDIEHHINDTCREIQNSQRKIVLTWINVLDAVAHRGEYRGYTIEEVYDLVNQRLLRDVELNRFDNWLIFSDHGNREWLEGRDDNYFGHSEDGVITGTLFDNNPKTIKELINRLYGRLYELAIESQDSEEEKEERKERLRDLGYL